ncbi:type II toxin-antitoxin system RelE/ParE family toxin [Zobellella taiwanensis]|uniref:Toxin HigB-2 n=1 Tax=Zobellella taiwanensis TaxID=347535 RepID=A0A2P7R9L6_9GAMM|nr:hypothetical protein [Zobellella taiwanensis]PSJ46927.1 hypothetical protein C7I36_03235 [Zobellella taiwanensis]
MIFIETPIFTADVKELLPDDEYRALQEHLASNPQAGPVIQDTGGLRKVRWSAQGKGKRGGVRVIYYHLSADSQIRMIFIYKKGIQDDLTPEQKKVLRTINEGWSHG